MRHQSQRNIDKTRERVIIDPQANEFGFPPNELHAMSMMESQPLNRGADIV